MLVDPTNTTATDSTLRDVEAAARAMGLQIQVCNASTIRGIDAAFATPGTERPDVLFVGGTGFFGDRRVQLVQLAARHAVLAIDQDRPDAEVGGLMPVWRAASKKRIINGFEVDWASERVFAEQQTAPNYRYLFEVSADRKRIVRCALTSQQLAENPTTPMGTRSAQKKTQGKLLRSSSAASARVNRGIRER